MKVHIWNWTCQLWKLIQCLCKCDNWMGTKAGTINNGENVLAGALLSIVLCTQGSRQAGVPTPLPYSNAKFRGLLQLIV
jgi:hypothetical protein